MTEFNKELLKALTYLFESTDEYGGKIETIKSIIKPEYFPKIWLHLSFWKLIDDKGIYCKITDKGIDLLYKLKMENIANITNTNALVFQKRISCYTAVFVGISAVYYVLEILKNLHLLCSYGVFSNN